MGRRCQARALYFDVWSSSQPGPAPTQPSKTMCSAPIPTHTPPSPPRPVRSSRTPVAEWTLSAVPSSGPVVSVVTLRGITFLDRYPTGWSRKMDNMGKDTPQRCSQIKNGCLRWRRSKSRRCRGRLLKGAVGKEERVGRTMSAGRRYKERERILIWRRLLLAGRNMNPVG